MELWGRWNPRHLIDVRNPFWGRNWEALGRMHMERTGKIGRFAKSWLTILSAAITSRSGPQSTSPTPPADTHKSDSERHNAPSLSVSPTRWWWTAVTTERSSWPSASLPTPSRSYVTYTITKIHDTNINRSTSWPTKTPSKSQSTPSSIVAPAKTRPELVPPVLSVVKPSTSHPSAVSTRPSPSSQLVPVKPRSGTLSRLLSALPKSWSTPRREAVTPTPSRRRMSWNVSPRAIGKWTVFCGGPGRVLACMVWKSHGMGFRFACVYGGFGRLLAAFWMSHRWLSRMLTLWIDFWSWIYICEGRRMLVGSVQSIFPRW